MYDTQIIADKIKKLAKSKNIKIKNMLSELSLGVNTISQLSKGQVISSINLARIADYLNCSVDYLLGRSNNIELINPVKSKIIELPKTKSLIMPLYEISASAGTGNPLIDETPITYITVEKTERMKQSDFLVKVKGDSMTPKFYEGDVVLVRPSRTISENSIGIFFLNGEIYIKKMGRGELISLNSSYAPIKLNEYDDVMCFGQVIDTVRM